MQGYSPEPIDLQVPAWASGQPFTVPLSSLAPIQYGGDAHLAYVDIHVAITPTLSSGALTALEAQNVIASLTFDDGLGLQRINALTGPQLRVAEAFLNGGQLVTPDPDDAATTERMDFVRRLFLFPPTMAGDGHDGLFPVAALKAATISGTWGTAAAMDANMTDQTITVQMKAGVVAKYGEVIAPPAFVQRGFAPAATDFPIPGVGIHTHLGIANAAALSAITAGDFANHTLTGASGVILNNQPGHQLTRQFNADYGNGPLRAFQGEPSAATDDAPKVVNGGTPTALTPAPAVFNPLLWPTKNGLITKQRGVSNGSLLHHWSGTQGTAWLFSAMLLNQTPEAQAKIIAAYRTATGKRQLTPGKTKTLSKRDYTGDRSAYLPFAVKVG